MMTSLLAFMYAISFCQVNPNIPLKQFIGKTLNDVITELNIDSSSFDFGGGLDDNILQYCYFDDQNSNSYLIWIETPLIVLPNKLTSKNYSRDKLELFNNVLKKEVTHISLSCTKHADEVHSGKGFFPLCSYEGKMLSTIIGKKSISDCKVFFDSWNQVIVFRIRYSNMNIYEIHVDPSDKELKKPPLSDHDLTFKDIQDCLILNIRIFSGTENMDLAERLLSLDGRSDK